MSALNPSNKQQSLRVDASGRLLTSPSGGGGGASSYTWAGKPTAASAGAGTVIVVTDIGPSRTQWVSDGTNWRPLNGRVTLFQQTGTATAPVSSISTTSGTATQFTGLPSLAIPGGMLYAGAKVVITAAVRRSAVGGSPVSGNVLAFLNGADGVVGGSQVGLVQGGSVVGVVGFLMTEAYIGTNAYMPTYNAPPAGNPQAGTGDRALTLANPSYVYFFGSSGYETGGTVQLIGYTVELVG